MVGRRLFRADTNGELLHRLLHDPIPAPSTFVPEASAFDSVCARALARAPEDRFPSADAFVEAIEQAAARTLERALVGCATVADASAIADAAMRCDLRAVLDRAVSRASELAVDGARLGRDGIDRAEFLIAPNPGVDPRPLRRMRSARSRRCPSVEEPVRLPRIGTSVRGNTSGRGRNSVLPDTSVL